MKPIVVKIGGSLVETGRVREVVAIVARARRPAVIVPGGGPFADAVRQAQADMGFSDDAAHRMALLAMEQTGLLMAELAPALVPAEALSAMRRAWAEKRVPVWMPARLCRRDKSIPRDWSITSDGLAARLAERLGRAEIVLLKSCRIERAASAQRLAQAGVVDAAFAEIVARARLGWTVLGPDEEEALAGMLQSGPARRSGRGSTKARGEASTARR